jgi:hypothetical protein
MARSRVKARRAPEVIAAEKAARAERRVAREAARLVARLAIRDGVKIARRKAKDETKRRAGYARTVNDAELIAHGNKKPVATGQTIIKSRVNEAPMIGFKRRGTLDTWEHTAANDIVTAYALSVGAPVTHDVDLGIRSEPRAGGADAQAAKRIDLLVHYHRWRRELANTPELAAAVAVLLDERSPYQLDREAGQRNGVAMKRFRRALERFAKIRGNTMRTGARIRAWTAPESDSERTC